MADFNQSTLLGLRVEIPPHFDAWMRGDRYGAIVGFPKRAKDYAYVRLDRNGAKLRVHMDYLTPV